MPGPSSSSLSTDIDSEGEDGSQSVVEGDSQPSVEGGSQPKKGKKEVLKPLGTPKNKMTWKKVEVKTNLTTVKGGFNTKYEMAPSVVCKMGNEQHAFVQLSKNHQWFLRGVGGCLTKKGDLKALAVFSDIRKGFTKADDAAAVAEEAAAVAEREPDESGEEDPMSFLDAPAEPKATANKARPTPKAKGRPKSKARSTIRTFSMPKHPPCSGWDPTCAGGEIEIHVYKRKTKTKADEEGCGNATCVYLRSDFIDWMLQSAADELIFQGVERNKEKEEQKMCNSEVAGMHLCWDFEKKTWTATFVDEVHVGTQKSFAVEQVTKEHCKKMIALSMIDRGTSDRKKISEQFIICWCQAIVDKKSAEFEKEWGLSPEQADNKRRRLRSKS